MNSPHFHNAKETPKKLVENRTSFAGENAVFSVYDTFKESKKVELKSESPMYCGMISGKKVIHHSEEKSFDFMPGESLVLPPECKILIDFPEARLDKPTKCITVELPRSRIDSIVDRMNERIPKNSESGEWKYDSSASVHFKNSKSIDLLINKLFHIFTEYDDQRDLLIEMNTSELIVHMLQTESRNLLLKNYHKHTTHNGLAAAIEFIHSNLNKPISIQKLADVACMSRASFYRYFNNEFGESPVDYINRKRMKKAISLLKDKSRTVTDVCFDLGFSSISHFIKLFKEHAGTTPKQYQLLKNQ